MDGEAYVTREYSAKDGARASMTIFAAEDDAAPVVICLPAMGVPARFYKKFAQTLQSAGLNVVTTDLRGIGTSSERASRACDFGYQEILSLDFPALVAAVERRFPANKRILLGHSLGGQLSALYLSAHPEAAQGLILVASCNVYYRGYGFPIRFGVLGIAFAFRGMAAALGYAPGDKIGFAGREARSLVVDWSNNCLTGRYDIVGGDYDYEASLRGMAKPILALSFARDALAPQRAVDNLLSKSSASSITHKHFPADYPGLERIGHFDWAKRPKTVVEEILKWRREADIS